MNTSEKRESVLVTTEWVAQHLDDPSIRIAESNEDRLLYRSGHIPGAVEIDWVRDLNDPVRRDYLQKEQLSELLSHLGVTPETTIVIYGDKSNWWACYAFWVLQLFGHVNAKIMDGGRLKWEREGRAYSREAAQYKPTQYPLINRDDSKIRIFRDDVLRHVARRLPLIDVRSPDEYTGKRLHMEGYPNEGALRGGHIPGAISIPWQSAINPADGTFKDAAELREIYLTKTRLTVDQEIVAYCRIGERSSHTWFALTYLLGCRHVKNYDGSWTEWGNLVAVPVEKGESLG